MCGVGAVDLLALGAPAQLEGMDSPSHSVCSCQHLREPIEFGNINCQTSRTTFGIWFATNFEKKKKNSDSKLR